MKMKLKGMSGTCKSASETTRIKNTFEAYRAGVATGGYSSEYAYAKCGCCHDRVPKIDGVWDQEKYKFLKDPYDINGEHLRVHPSLWNNGTNNVLSGVFEVLPGRIYQVRGYDMANISFVKTNNTGESKISDTDRWMVMDTLMSIECTQAALELFDEYLKTKKSGYSLKGNIVGMIVSHSHVDHYGGMSTVKSWFVNDETAELINAEGKEKFKDSEYPRIDVPFIHAPNGFFEHSVSENVYVGNAMGRRASFQYGSFIKPDYKEGAQNDPNDYLSGEISIGIGQGQSTGEISFEVPTMEIGENCTLTLDNLQVGFQLTPGTEAPAEMNNYFPEYNALWLAENCNGTLHNLYTLRGAQVRDGKAWAGYLMETVALYGNEVKVIFQSHNWPHWDNSLDSGCIPTNGIDKEFPRTDLKAFLIDTAAIYKYINDQTLLYMNMGYKMNEASDMLTLPRAMQKNWCLKPFYGTPKHNAKAVYQKYLGWYDANPIHLEELPPELLAKEQMRYMMAGGCADNILKMIEDDVQKGNYWTAAYMAHQLVIGSEDANIVNNAKVLCAEALEQLGYQCESGTWRNAYLCAAYELRNQKARVSASGAGMWDKMTVEMLLDYISILFDGYIASNLNFEKTIKIDDVDNIDKYYLIVVKNGCMLYHMLELEPTSVTSVARNTLINMIKISQGLTADKPTDPDFAQLLSCMVNLNIDRYKYFDIVNRHDSEVLVGDEHNDLRGVAIDCFNLLNKYVSKALSAGESTISFNDDKDKNSWGGYYTILVKEAKLLLDGDFFLLENPNAGIGKDGVFFAYELFYDLYSLLNYLNSYSIKNDYKYQDLSGNCGNYIKLKKKIQLLELYVPDCYLNRNENKILLDKDDSAAWSYLNNEAVTDEIVEMSVSEIMYTLYMLHYELAGVMGTINIGKPNMSLDEYESTTTLKLSYKLPYAAEYFITWGNQRRDLDNQQGTILVDISGEQNQIIFSIYQKLGNVEILMSSLTFNKPQLECSTSFSRTKQEVERLALENNGGFCELINIGTEADPIIAAAYEAPSRPINYTLYYSTQNVDKLIVNGKEQQNVSSGSVTIQSRSYSVSFNVVGYSKCGFYVQQKVSCSG